MDELIKMITKNLNIDASVAEKAVAAVVQFLKGKLGEQAFGSMLGGLPGVKDIVSKGAGAAEAEGGSLLGSVMKAASKVVGGGTGDAMALTGSLQESGLDVSKFGDFGKMFLDFIRQKLGAETVDKLLTSLPELKKMIG